MSALVVIGVASYRRRVSLLRLIASLEQQALPAPGPHVRIVIVDNSPEHDLADLSFPGARFPITLAHEPVPGISAARNRALAVARGEGADFLAFIDDDERADSDWLTRLLVAQARADADVVVGAVRGEPAPDAPKWIAPARVFDADPPTHARAVGSGYSSNVLFRLAAAENLQFDPAFGLTGGEDTLFFAQMHQAGARFAAARDAIVREPTAPDRARLSWLLRRWTRAAISEGEIEQKLGVNTRLGVAEKGATRLLAGAALVLLTAPVSWGKDFGRCAKYLRVAARGWGFLMSAARLRIVEYQR